MIKRKGTDEAKKELKNVEFIRDDIQNLEEKIEEMDTKIKGSAIQYGDKVQCSSEGAEKLLCSYIDMKSEYQNMVAQRNNQILEILRKINKIRNYKQQIVLRERYINCNPWKTIALRMGKDKYSESTLHRIHRLALIEYQNILNNEKLTVNNSK